MDEVAAAKGDPDMGGAARDSFKEHQIASFDVIGVDLAADAVLLLDLAGSASPCCANTHCTKPLQSNPDGSLPPLTYGVPRRESAREITAG